MDLIPESFIREILKVSTQPNMISFAGGLPNPEFFPIEKIAAAAEKVLSKDGKSILQYAPTEGYKPLRAYIADRQSSREGVTISPEDVLILNGSQQGLDLTAKIFLNNGTNILLEEPSYLGAIQAFSAYQPNIATVPLSDKGPEPEMFLERLREFKPAFFYSIPNFQNPTGFSYETDCRYAIAEASNRWNTICIEDDPYGEIYFSQKNSPTFHALRPEYTIHLGSFSKIISPGLRLGYAIANPAIIKKLTIAKQASDLHSNNLSQRIIYQFLIDNSIDDHLNAIRSFYKSQRDCMISLLTEHLPSGITWSVPEGGMFLWLTLPSQVSARELLDLCIKESVIFVPGECFYFGEGKGKNTIRLNFSNPSEEQMKRGIVTMGNMLRKMVQLVQS
jgi:2-aminoadipate transaminase